MPRRTEPASVSTGTSSSISDDGPSTIPRRYSRDAGRARAYSAYSARRRVTSARRSRVTPLPRIAPSTSSVVGRRDPTRRRGAASSRTSARSPGTARARSRRRGSARDAGSRGSSRSCARLAARSRRGIRRSGCPSSAASHGRLGALADLELVRLHRGHVVLTAQVVPDHREEELRSLSQGRRLELQLLERAVTVLAQVSVDGGAQRRQLRRVRQAPRDLRVVPRRERRGQSAGSPARAARSPRARAPARRSPSPAHRTGARSAASSRRRASTT